MAQRTLGAIAVFCGSNHGDSPAFAASAALLGTTLAERRISLIYGGSSSGLMGKIADAALTAGGSAIGVIPAALRDKEIAHTGLTELHVVDSMHSRKLRMAELADAFIAMPGGFGTLDESFEALTWTQLGIHSKPLGFLNVDGFYDGLLSFADTQTAHGFVRAAHRDMVIADDGPEALIDQLANVELPSLGKWRNDSLKA